MSCNCSYFCVIGDVGGVVGERDGCDVSGEGVFFVVCFSSPECIFVVVVGMRVEVMVYFHCYVYFS